MGTGRVSLSTPNPWAEPVRGALGSLGTMFLNLGERKRHFVPEGNTASECFVLFEQWVGLEGCGEFHFVSQNFFGFVAVLLTAFIALGQ